MSPRTRRTAESTGTERIERTAPELDRNFGEFCRVLTSISDPVLTEQLLRQLLTRAEVREVAGRWELVKLLDSGLSQRRIADELGMSLCKITRGSRELKKPDSALKMVIHEYTGRSTQ